MYFISVSVFFFLYFSFVCIHSDAVASDPFDSFGCCECDSRLDHLGILYEWNAFSIVFFFIFLSLLFSAVFRI